MDLDVELFPAHAGVNLSPASHATGSFLLTLTHGSDSSPAPSPPPAIRAHNTLEAGRERLFISRDGSPLRGHTLYQAFVRARKRVGMDNLTFHDLRHTGQTLAAQTGATLADLMKRLGRSSMAAARRYLHAVDGRDQEIAKALSEPAAHGDVARLAKTSTM
ncbi:tyrosine-type recombinase/integrase [Salinispora arenicola]|uniref:tyrosine-type recombinase/integrase n=1 Tax=Salinispora arenicola TaxID=168697 RepID=UPI003CC76033